LLKNTGKIFDIFLRLMKTIFIYILCIAGALFLQVNATGQSLQDNDRESNLVIYPNPATGPVHIEFKSANRTKPDAVILDITGKEVMQISEELTFSDDHFAADINISGLKPGIYFIKIVQNGEAHLSKIMIR